MSSVNPEHLRWYEEQIQPHEPMLRAYLAGRYPDLPDVDNLVQESLVRVLRAHEKMVIKSPKALLFTIGRNLALDILRRQRLVYFEPITDNDDLSVLSNDDDVVDNVSKQQELALLAEAIQTLPDRCRQVLTLRTAYGLSQKAIAAELGISENAVEKHMTKGIRRCTEYFARRGLL